MIKIFSSHDKEQQKYPACLHVRHFFRLLHRAGLSHKFLYRQHKDLTGI